MDGDQGYILGTASLALGALAVSLARRRFDPFDPRWLFLVGYFQVYVIQAVFYREWALRTRGMEVVSEANWRAFWALGWFLLVYALPAGRSAAGWLPSAPRGWSTGLALAMTPLLMAWGGYSARLPTLLAEEAQLSREASLLYQFPIFLLASGVLLIVTGRHLNRGGSDAAEDSTTGPGTAMVWAGAGICALYVLIWMFNGKRSHSLFGVLSGVCAFYVSKGRRPSLPVLAATAALGSFAVAMALGWRAEARKEYTLDSFARYVQNFDPKSVLVSLNMRSAEEDEDPVKAAGESKETEEYGGYLLMLDTVPSRADHDYGANYLRVFTSYIPRVVWPTKPLFGREEWIRAWVNGSEFDRDEDFTGPAIGVLGACQLNGGALATAIVMAALALLLRTAYEYFRAHAGTPWAQAWWSLTFFNAWLMTVNDDPMVWYYYVYGHTTFPLMIFLWLFNKGAGDARGGTGR